MNIILIISIGLIAFYQEVAAQGSDDTTFLQLPSTSIVKEITREEDEKDRKEGETPSPNSTPLCSPFTPLKDDAGDLHAPDSPPPLEVLGKDGKWRKQIKNPDGKWINAPEK